MTTTRLDAACAGVLMAISGAVQAAPISGQGTWETTLQGRDLDGDFSNGFEAYYDTLLNITWLANANYAGYGMYWDNANAWAASLNPYGSGITGWRLPITVDVGNDGPTYTNIYQGVDYGYNITTHSEMSHMFYVTLGNTAYYTTSGVATGCVAPNYCLTNTGPFSNLQPWGYWSATDYVDSPFDAWGFGFSTGGQSDFSILNSNNYAWAVHAGDVGASAVPMPAAAWLFGSGLIGLLGAARRRH